MLDPKSAASSKCLTTHFEGLKEALRTGKKFEYTCYLGFSATAIPLSAYGKRVGGMTAGRAFTKRPDPKLFEILESLGLSKDEFLKLALTMEIIPWNRYEQWVQLLEIMAASIVRGRSQEIEEKKRARRLHFISDLSRHVGEDLDRLLDFIVHSLPEACELEKCTVFLLDEARGELVAKASNAFSLEDLKSFKVSVRNERGEVVVESEPFVSPDAPHDERLIKEYVDRCQIKSLLTVPLRVRDKTIGVIHFVNSKSHHYFTSEEISFVNALATEVSLAIESTLFEEERKARAAELERFRSEVQGYFTQIGRAITSALDIQSLLHLISELSMRVVRADSCAVYFVVKGELEEKLRIGDVPDLEERAELNLKTIQELDSIKVERGRALDSSQSWTFARVPLKTQEETVGFLVLYSRDSREISPEERDVLSAFAAQAALSINNIRLFEAEREKAREMSQVYEAAQLISESVELEPILSETARQMCALSGVNRCFVFLLDEERKVLSTAFVHGVSAEERDFFSALAVPMNFLGGALWERFRHGRPLILYADEELEKEALALTHLFSVFGTKNCVLVPLVSEERLTGLLYLDELGKIHEFSDSQIRSIAALSIHAGTAIERAQLTKQSEDQAKQVHTLYQISTALSTTLNLDRILELVIEKTAQLVPVERFCLFMWNEELAAFKVAASRGLSKEFIEKAVVKIEDRFVGLASSRKKPIYSANVLLETDNPHLARLFKKEGLGAVLAVPLVTKGKSIGVITYFAELGHQFKEKEIHLLGNFASHASLSIENARLYNLNRQKVQELGILFDVGKHISEHLNPQDVLKSMAEQFISVMKADGCSVMLVDKDEKTLSIQVTRGIARRSEMEKRIPIGEGFVGKVARTMQPLAIEDNEAEREHKFPSGLREEGITTVLSVPLAAKNDLLGVVNLYSKERRRYSASEMHLIQTLAGQSAVALRNAQTFEENYHVAQLIHRSLLPSHVPVIPDLEFGFQYLPSEEISGDYYDFLEMRGKLGITVADVSGKGTGAAIFTAQGKYAWKAYGMIEDDPKQVLEKLNHLMVENTPSDRFISLFYGVLDLKKKEFEYSNAGHLPPILYRSASKKCRDLEAPGLLLGVNENAEFVKRSVNLHSGDVLVFYTDGVVEARNESRHMYGTDRLEKIIIENAESSAQVIANRILSSVRQFALRRTLEDDITIVVLKIK